MSNSISAVGTDAPVESLRLRLQGATSSANGYLVLLAGLLFIWWLVAQLELVRNSIVPRPQAVAEVAFRSRDELLGHVGVTLTNVALAVLIVWVAGLMFGTLLATVGALTPMLAIARMAYSLPIIAIFPILIVWFGYGSLGKIVFGVIFGLPPMILLTASSLRTVDRSIYVLFDSLGASRLTAHLKGTLPASVEGVLGAMRLSGALSLGAVITGELLVANKGIGYWVSHSDSLFNMPAVYAGILIVMVMAVSLHALLQFVEYVVLRSRRGSTKR